MTENGLDSIPDGREPPGAHSPCPRRTGPGAGSAAQHAGRGRWDRRRIGRLRDRRGHLGVDSPRNGAIRLLRREAGDSRAGYAARVVRRTTALAYGVLGVCLGGCLGLAGGVARRRAAASVAGGLLGAVLGAVLGGQATLWLLPSLLELRHNHQNLDMIIGMLIHGVIWGPLGAAAGLAFAVGLGDSRFTGRAAGSRLRGGGTGHPCLRPRRGLCVPARQD